MEDAEKKKAGTNLTPNEKHFYWQEICRHEDLTRDNFKIKDNIEIYNADKPTANTKVKLNKFSQDAGRIFIVPTNTTAKVRVKNDPEETKKVSNLPKIGFGTGITSKISLLKGRGLIFGYRR